MSDHEATTWRLLLQQPDLVEQIAILPTEFVRALGGFVQAAIDLADEAYAISYGQEVDSELGRKVQSSGTGITGRKVTNRRFASHLERNLSVWLERERESMSRMLRVGEGPRMSPRFRERRMGA